jgi:hypothetical protein
MGGLGDYWREARERKRPKAPGPSFLRMNCPHCGQRIKTAGLADHLKAKHKDIKP